MSDKYFEKNQQLRETSMSNEYFSPNPTTEYRL